MPFLFSNKLRAFRARSQTPPQPAAPRLISASLTENLAYLRGAFAETSDLVVRRIVIGGRECALINMEGLISQQAYAQGVLDPIMKGDYEGLTAEEQFERIRDSIVALSDQMQLNNFDEVFGLIMSGFAVILLDGVACGLSVGMQGYSFRSVSEPATEAMQRGSREGFVEVIRINLSMVRRRMKTPDLRFEMMQVGTRSKTDVALCYLNGVVSQEILQKVRARLQACPLETVLESGYLQPFLDDRPLSLFTGVGLSERPDTVCGKITEGRIAVFVDGTPMVLIVPYLFVENFQSFDDYADRPYFAAFTRWMKYLAFLIATLLPGLFVAIGTFHPALFPTPMLYNLVSSEASQPFSLMLEALVIHFIYELMREAGLRLPKPIGHAVGIIGGLVIGDAAVQAGLIGAPMIMVVALTAMSSFVIPQLYEPVAVLRFAFIVIGGCFTFFGLVLAFAAVLVNLCAVGPYGVPYTAPLSPLRWRSLRDVLVRQGWKRLGKHSSRIQNMPGSEERDPEK
ncbi:MAG: spore germination protein [Firmicutes bacterium]|nr:spore germination protein [Bacillota bacterium]